MTDFKSKTCCVVDHGLFVELAVTLAKSFGCVYYYCPWEDGFPKSNSLLIGEGIPGVRRLRSFWPLLDEIDLFVFPDVYLGPLQAHLESLGKRVWGSRLGEDLELDRVGSKRWQKQAGIDIGPYKIVKGLPALRDYLKNHDHKWVKISATRGDMETFYAKNYTLIEPALDQLEHGLGAKKDGMEFIVEDDIPDAVEIGYDGYCVDGKFPRHAMVGIEIKSQGYVGKTVSYTALPSQVRELNDKLGPAFREFGYRGFFSSEIRVTRDGKGYSIDPCARMGCPPGELYQLLITNWPDIIWEGSVGTVVEPIFAAKWGAEVLLLSEWAAKNWLTVHFPPAIRENVKLRNLTIINGSYHSVPQASGDSAIGAVVAVGDTMQAAIAECRRLAAMVEGHEIECPTSSLDDAEAEFEKLREFGIKI